MRADDPRVPAWAKLIYDSLFVGVSGETEHLAEDYAVAILNSVVLGTTDDLSSGGPEYATAHPTRPGLSHDRVLRMTLPVLRERVIRVEYMKLRSAKLLDAG